MKVLKDGFLFLTVGTPDLLLGSIKGEARTLKGRIIYGGTWHKLGQTRDSAVSWLLGNLLLGVEKCGI